MENMIHHNTSCSWVRGKCIGKGSFGSVHLAVNKTDDQIFAVKSVDLNNNLSSQIEAIESEIQLLKSISSPCIINYLGDDVTYESSSTSHHRNLHIEYMPGGTVNDVVSSRFGGKSSSNDVDEGVVKSYTLCILTALKYLHARNIVHCDVKGKNILVGHVTGTCKLSDFGSAIKLSDHHNRKEKSPVVVSRGSPLWMAPEVVRQEYQGPESDVWSLGCTVIEMMTGGKSAWKDEGMKTLHRIGYSNELPEIPTQLSETARDFVKKCLMREKSERWCCDELLKHDFVSTVTLTAAESSPRCVLDSISSEFTDKDEDEDEDDDAVTSNSSSVIIRGRIMKLASSSTRGGAIWEIEDWTTVRDCNL